MKKTLLLFSLLIAVSFSLDKITIPYDFNTVSSGKRAYLADNYDEVEDKTNYLIDSTQQLRDIFSGYLSDLVLTSQDNFTVQLDEDGDGDKLFIVLSDGGDTLLKVSEDSTGCVILGTITSDSLNVNGTTINNLGVLNVNNNTVLDGDLTVDADLLFVDASANKIGFGNNTPVGSYGFGASNEIYITSNIINAAGDTNGNAELVLNQAGYNNWTSQFRDLNIKDGKNNSLAFFDGSQGKIGFGTETPATHLEIKKLRPVLQLSDETLYNNNPYSIIRCSYPYNIANDFVEPAFIKAGKENDTSGNVASYVSLFTRDNSSGQDLERLRVNSSGYVGIDTESPDGLLHVFGGSAGTVTSFSPLTVENSSTSGIQILSPNTTAQYLNFGDQDDLDVGSISYSHVGNSFIFSTNATQQVVIQNDGDVGIGTVLPDAKLHIIDGTGDVFVAGNNPTLTLQDTSSSGPEINFVGPSDGLINLNFGDVDNYDETQITVSPINKSFAVAVNDKTSISIDSNAVVTLGNTGTGVVALGDYLRLPVKTDTGDPSSPEDGWMYVNTLDNKVRVYADGAWRDLATW